MHSEKKTRDYFLPFGINFQWSYTLTKWLFRCLVIYLFLDYESNKLILFNSYFDVVFNIIFFSLLSYYFLKAPYNIFKRYKIYELQKYSQFILIEYENKIVGYARFAEIKSYSVIYHIYIVKSLKQELINCLTKNIINQAVEPIYIACREKDKQDYINIGFNQITIQELPENLRFRGWLNQRFGGNNLVYK